MALELTTETSDSLIRTLRELVQIPSISLEGPDSPSISECANRVADEFRSLGASVEMLEIPDAPPAVFGEFKSSCIHELLLQKNNFEQFSFKNV